MFLHCNLFYVIIFHFTRDLLYASDCNFFAARLCLSATALWSQLRRCVATCWVEAFLWLNRAYL